MPAHPTEVTVQMLPRSTWTGVPRPTAKLTRIDPAELRGIAIHWPGSTGRFADPTLAQSCARIEAERRQHTSPSLSDPSKPWSDIAYSAAVDLAGRLFDARGAEWRSAANGDATQNRRYLAVTVLAGIGEVITPEAVEAVRWWREHVVLPRYPHATEVVGHRDLHGTDCPGPDLYRLVLSGAFTGPAAATQTATTTTEDDMQLSELSSWDLSKQVGEKAGTVNFQTLIARTYMGVIKLQAQQIDYARLADELAKRGVQVDAAAIADALAAKLAAELTD